MHERAMNAHAADFTRLTTERDALAAAVRACEAERDAALAAIAGLFAAADKVLAPDWRDDTLGAGDDGDELNAAWDVCAAIIAPEAAP